MSFWTPIASVDFDQVVISEHFFSGVKVLIERPHVVNPKLLTAEIISTENVPLATDWMYQYLRSGEFCEKHFKEVISKRPIKVSKDSEDSDLEDQGQVIFRSVLPKRFHLFKDVSEVVLLDFLLETATFFPRKSDVLNSPITPAFPYKFKRTYNGIQLSVPKCSENKSVQTLESEKWLTVKVLPKLSKWCQNVPKQPILFSLQLVPAKNYSETLHYLKKKYATKFVEIWPLHNNTDPIKYVYEDLSIAAYLITLWSEERKTLNLVKKQTFVDLGCGHGLVDHILQSEGHNGIGYDLRKRKMWDVYGDETKLIEMVIEPSDKQLYPEYDWIIGNHPDELTPWIPVIAARSSYNMRVFLLPCCFYTFDGKYVRSHQEYTQYQSYLNFIKTLCETMGFETRFDKLRIPSTKRTCLVCSSRTYEKKDEAQLENKRKEFIASHSKKVGKALSTKEDQTLDRNSNSMENSYCLPPETEPSATKWAADFIPRESVEIARNCTTLDKTIIDEVVLTIVNALLATENYVSIQRDNESILWNKGGVLKLKSIYGLLNQQLLKSMKNQRGGFQTLIRNHKSIFEVKNDCIQLRMPSTNPLPPDSNVRSKNRKHKRKRTKYDVYKKECYFYFYHPQSCPLSVSDCTYSHEKLSPCDNSAQ